MLMAQIANKIDHIFMLKTVSFTLIRVESGGSNSTKSGPVFKPFYPPASKANREVVANLTERKKSTYPIQ